MPPDPPHAHSPSPSTSSASASQQAIASSARGIVKGWAVGSGLEGAGDGESALFFASLSRDDETKGDLSRSGWGGAACVQTAGGAAGLVRGSRIGVRPFGACRLVA